MSRLIAVVALAAAASPFGVMAAGPTAWPQFGGPGRDFRVPGATLEPWPAAGPTRLWERDLGDGYSGIVSDGATLYTMYRSGDDDVSVALDADTGDTRWEQRDAAPFLRGMNMEHGPGPHSTPLLVGGRLFTVGVTGRLAARDPATGKVLWARELWHDLGGQLLDRGYSCSPLAWNGLVIVAVGGDHGLVAFDQEDGTVRWQSPPLSLSPSSPTLLEVAGRQQLIFFAGNEVVGLDPSRGTRLWGYPHETNWDINVALPVAAADDVLLISSAYDGGTRALRLRHVGQRTLVRELWFDNRMRVHHANLVRIGDAAYGSSGDFGPAPLSAVDVATGEVLWRDRAFAKANLLETGGGRLLVLDEDGTLALVAVDRGGAVVLAQEQVFHGRAWTAPILVGTRLYARDRQRILALDLAS